MDCSTPGLPVHHQLPEFTQTHVHWVGDAIQPSHTLSSPSLPAFNLSQHQDLFKWVSSSHQVAKVLGVSASTSVLPMNAQDWFPLGWTGLISLQSKGLSESSEASILWRSTFFMAQLSHPYMTTGKTVASTREAFVGKVMSLLFNLLSRLVIVFLIRSRHLLISWLWLTKNTPTFLIWGIAYCPLHKPQKPGSAISLHRYLLSTCCHELSMVLGSGEKWWIRPKCAHRQGEK